MMSKKQWFVVLCIFITYLLLGAALFYIIESKEEDKRVNEEIRQRHVSVEFIDQIYNKSQLMPRRKDFTKSLEDYCGKPFEKHAEEPHHVWDYYHSVFFVITVVSTIGYGNIAPTTMFTRLFMIFYGLIGIPLCGIVMVTLGTFFGRSFTKLYQRWKTSKMQYDTTKLGLISQIILYLVPGFTFFCFLPSAFMVIFEDWSYDVAVYYCFVTLTTIGFGDYVAGVENPNEFKSVPCWIYKVFLLVWVIGGLGYVVMILGFITKALQSRKIRAIEQMIKHNMKKTPVRIRQELRTLLQEFLFMKVKHAYKGEFDYIPSRLERTQSCPDLNIYRNVNSPTIKRKRAFSECPHHLILQSDNNLDRIDRDSVSDNYMQSDLLKQVVDALSILEDQDDLGGNRGYDGFSESEILASERFGSKWSLRSQSLTPSQPKQPRRRAVSDVRVPPMHKVEAHHDITWYGQDAADNYQTFLDRQRAFSESGTEMEKNSQNLITRFKNRFISPRDDRDLDVEQNRRRVSMFNPPEDRYLRQTNRGRASVMSVQQQEAVLEQTSIADFIRALSSITGPDTMLQPSAGPKRKLGTAGLTPPKTQSPPRTRRLAIRPTVPTRRTSLMPDSNIVQNERRRLSLRPVEENIHAPPPYSAHPDEVSRPARRFSRLLNVPNVSISPVQRQVNKRENKDDS